MLPSDSTALARSATGDGSLLTTAYRSGSSIEPSTARVSVLLPLCEMPMIGCCDVGNGSGWSPAPSRHEWMPRLRSSHTGAHAAARLAPMPTKTGPGPAKRPADCCARTSPEIVAIAVSSASACVARALAKVM